MTIIKVVSLLLLAAILVVQLACGGATEVPAATPPVNAEEPAPEIPDRIPKIWRDFSQSANEDDVKAATPQIIVGIRGNLSALDGVEVVRFSEGESSIWSASSEKFFWGPPPEVKPFVEPDLNKAPLGAKMYQTDRDDYLQQARNQYDAEKARILSAYNSRVNKELDRLQHYLLEMPNAAAPCTRFANLKLRIEEENRSKNLIITDGWADCGEESTVSDNARFTGKVVVLLVTRHADNQADEDTFNQRKDYMRRVFPSAEVVPTFVAERTVNTLLR